LLVFTDPDIYAPPGWLDSLVRAQRQLGGVIVGGIACYGRNWLDLGIHLSKFDLFLPGGEPRSLDIAATANMICTRADFERVGGFDNTELLADTLLSWSFSGLRIPITFVPGATVDHHHTHSWIEMIHERFVRGRDFGRLRAHYGSWGRLHIAWQLILTILPIRLARLCGRIFLNAIRAGMLVDFLITFPVSLSGQSAWLMGEVVAYWEILRS
jgi:GT2 family glycosyltransferase